MMVAAESLVKWVANRICWVAVSVIDYLVKRMFLWVTLLSFGWMVTERGESEVGLMTQVWVRWILPWLAASSADTHVAGRMPIRMVCMVSISLCVLMVNLLVGRQTVQAAVLVYEIVVI